MFEELPSKKAYTLLESGPVVLVTTSWRKRHNIMTMGFHMMVQHEPALVACVIGPWDHSYTAVRKSGECVIAVPTVELAEQVARISFILEVERIWIDRDKREKRLIHHAGDGIFTVDGATVDMREHMVKWRYLMD